VSRIVSGKLRLEVKAVNLCEVIRAALDSARPAMDAKQLEIHAALDPELWLMGDATRLQQVVWNLLTNATKFTPTAGSIRIDLKRADSMLELTVADSGKGIGPAFLSDVFRPFMQADGTTTRSHGGLGLGLSIAKNLVEMHGGTIAVYSEGEGRGSVFVVCLPLAPLRSTGARDSSEGRPARTGPKWERPPEIAGLRVLVVDDERDARDLIATVLEYCGAVVEHAGSAHEGLEKLDAWRPDVLLSDIGMPGEDGFALIRQVRGRALSKGGSIPVASLTAYAGSEDRRRALLAGFNMHVAKPIEPAELVAVVANLARLARALR
jgi:CheY-like chemotaxis protein